MHRAIECLPRLYYNIANRGNWRIDAEDISQVEVGLLAVYE